VSKYSLFILPFNTVKSEILEMFSINHNLINNTRTDTCRSIFRTRAWDLCEEENSKG
jgi:hypothetical protein